MSAETIEAGTTGEGAEAAPTGPPPPMGPPPVVRRAYLRKLKTMRKKYFVLKSDTSEHSARLEYYDSEKKWKSNGLPKRIISLKTCYNITRRLDTKHKHVIALHMTEECFCMVLDGEEELGHWLNAMLLLNHGSDGSDHLYHPRQHVWQVNVQKKGLGASKNILGLYHLCLTDMTVTLVKIKSNTVAAPSTADTCVSGTVQFSLSNIRRCGDSECFFYMELGRSAVTGSGELWMHTDDSNIAQSMHATILHAMSNIPAISKEEMRPKSRTRSSSANEASKPMSVLARRQYTGTKPYGGMSPSAEQRSFCGTRICMGSCISECVSTSATCSLSQEIVQEINIVPKPDTNIPKPQVQASAKSEPPNNNSLISSIDNINNVSCANDIISHLLPHLKLANRLDHSLQFGLQPKSCAQQHQRTIAPSVASYVTRPTEDGVLKICHGRTRSLPLAGDELMPPPDVTRPMRFNSSSRLILNGASCDNGATQCSAAHHRPKQAPWAGRRASTGCRLAKWSPSHTKKSSPSVRERCDSLPSRSRLPSDLVPLMVAPSPPHSSMRPYSVCGSGASLLGDSAASHLNEMGWDTSVDEVDGPGVGCSSMSTLAEWNAPHITPRSIPEEDAAAEADAYMPMDMQHTRTPSVGHSRTSSLVGVTEGESTGEGYLPMAPAADAGYVDMERRRNTHALSPAHSSCSVTSGTPSTDIRFLEYHLDKVTSYLTASEEEQESRPIRAYSVGSRPDAATRLPHRTEVIVADQARARAVSVGSRTKARPTPVRPPPSVQLHSTHTRKSSSAPVLPRAPGSNEPLDDLMELDFSHNKSSRRKQPSTPRGTPETREIPLHPALPLNNLSSSVDKRRTDEYVDMSPGSADASTYMMMKPSNLGSPIVSSSPLAVPDCRRVSLSRSPPVDVLATTPEGYMPMAWNFKLAMDNHTDHNRIPSQPITIQANNIKNVKDVERSPRPRLSNALSLDMSATTPPKSSTSSSPQTPLQFPSSRRNSKMQGRRNSKELIITPSHSHSGIFMFSPNGPASPAKSFAVSTPKPSAERKCQVDASSGTVRLATGESFDDEDDLDDLENSAHYMDITPSGLTTVKEIAEPSVKYNFENRKSMNPLMNTAAKRSELVDLADYVNIDGKKFRKPVMSKHFSADDSLEGDYAVMDPSVVRICPVDASRPIAAKSRNITRKMFAPGFPEDESKEGNRFSDPEVLPSNPTAVPSIDSVESPHKSRSVKRNNKSVPKIERPILVTVTGQIQNTTANFKPNHVDETEVQSHSGSPKPTVESVLNRRLVAAGKGGRDSPRLRANCCVNKSRPSSTTSDCSESRPASVETTERSGLHYASLDLDGGERSPRHLPLSAGPDVNLAPAFTYSQIDFVKSGEYNAANTVTSAASNST